ncbi:MAG: hypothetical protein OXG24_08695 [Gammaproteobacteria bacterium]|nr:hypothetical protein [Gammaproteobacteria bacterium]
MTTKKILLFGLLIFAVVGWALFLVVSISIDKTSSASSVHSGQSEQQSVVPDRLRVDSSSQIDLDTLSEYESGFERSTALYSMLTELNRDQLLAIWEQSKQIERNSVKQDQQVVIIRRLTVVDPILALERTLDVPRLHRSPFLEGVFQEWSQTDLDEAISRAKHLEKTDRRVALRTILQLRDDVSDNRHRDIAKQLDMEEEFLRIQSEVAALGTSASSSDVWNIVISDDVKNSLQIGLLKEISEACFQEDGFVVLSNAARSIADPNDREILLEVISPIVRLNPQGALDYSMGLPQEENELLTSAIFLVWSDLSPETALVAVPSYLENVTKRKSLQHELVYRWAVSNPDGILEKIEQLPDELKTHAIETAIARTTLKSPERAISQMKQLDRFLGNDSRVTARIVTEWSRYDPRAASDWIVSNMENSNVERHRLFDVALRQLVVFEPSYALEVALDQPVDENGRGLELSLVNELASNGNTTAAVEMLPSIRGGSARVSALVAIGTGYVREDSPKDALNVASHVPQNYKWYFHNEVFRIWAHEAPRKLFETLEELTSAEIRSRAAMQLLIANRSNAELSEDRISFVKSFLSDRDAIRAARLEDN